MVCWEIDPASILYRFIAGRYRPVSYPAWPITARYRFIKKMLTGRAHEFCTLMGVLRTIQEEVTGVFYGAATAKRRVTNIF